MELLREFTQKEINTFMLLKEKKLLKKRVQKNKKAKKDKKGKNKIKLTESERKTMREFYTLMARIK